MPTYRPLTKKIRRCIAEKLGNDCILADMSGYDRDASELRHTPDLVLAPTHADQIQMVMRLAGEHHFPVTPRGGGSGLAGGCLAVDGGVVLTLEKMNRILSVDPANLIADVQPGVITADLKAAAAAKGLFYPPDPAGLELSTIGGNAATNAGGPACVKYGTTKDYVLGIEAVLPDGTLVRAGTRTRKGVVGYDMTQLLVGSEGTLGIITRLILKLLPLPPAVGALTASFTDLPTAMKAVAAVMSGGLLPSAIEFMDAKCLHLVGDLLPFELAGKHSCLLIIEADGRPDSINGQIEAIAAICKRMGASELSSTSDEKQRQRIWEVRRQISLRIHDSADVCISEDVAVPLDCIAELTTGLPLLEKEFNTTIYAFGHAGDGNIHLNITSDSRSGDNRIQDCVRAILKRVIDMGGTISGEHGIGSAKRQFLTLELSDTSIRLQRGIKKLFDPGNILNPGKIFP